jgi:hypothetical protein
MSSQPVACKFQWPVFLLFAATVLTTNGLIAYFLDGAFYYYQPLNYSLIGVAWVGVLVRLRFHPVIIGLSLLSMTFSLLLTSTRDPAFDTYDWVGHHYYITYILKNGYPPLPTDGWSSQHPPLYYYIAALVLGSGIGQQLYTLAGLKLLTCICMRMFSLFGLLLIRMMVRRKYMQWLCSAMLLFWPRLVTIGGFINNDPLAYSFCAIATYFLFRWRMENFRSEWLGTALWACALMMLTKTNAVVPLAAIGLSAAYALARGNIRFLSLRERKIICPALFVFVSASYSFGRILYNIPDAVSIFSPNVAWDPIRDIITQQRTLYNLFYFDVAHFMTQTGFNIRSDKMPFWNAYAFQFLGVPLTTGLNLWPYYARIFLLSWAGMLCYGSIVLYRAKALPLMLLACVALALVAQWGFYFSVMTNPSTHPRYTLSFLLPTLLALQGVILERTSQPSHITFNRGLIFLAYGMTVGIIAQMTLVVFTKAGIY